MRAKRQYFKATDKAQFETAFTNYLTSLGITLDEPLAERGTISATYTKTETIELEEGASEEMERKVRFSIDYIPTEVKAKDVDGNFIVTETDEDGNPTTYQMETGYFVNTSASERISLPEIEEKTPEQPQSKFA